MAQQLRDEYRCKVAEDVAMHLAAAPTAQAPPRPAHHRQQMGKSLGPARDSVPGVAARRQSGSQQRQGLADTSDVRMSAGAATVGGGAAAGAARAHSSGSVAQAQPLVHQARRHPIFISESSSTPSMSDDEDA
jgi:hypothetical protein